MTQEKDLFKGIFCLYKIISSWKACPLCWARDCAHTRRVCTKRKRKRKRKRKGPTILLTGCGCVHVLGGVCSSAQHHDHAGYTLRQIPKDVWSWASYVARCRCPLPVARARPRSETMPPRVIACVVLEPWRRHAAGSYGLMWCAICIPRGTHDARAPLAAYCPSFSYKTAI